MTLGIVYMNQISKCNKKECISRFFDKPEYYGSFFCIFTDLHG